MTHTVKAPRFTAISVLALTAMTFAFAPGAVSAGEATAEETKSTKSVVHPMSDFSIPVLVGN